MRLRLKVLIILAFIWLIMSLSIYIYSQNTLSTEYLQLEKKEMISNIKRTGITLNNMMSSLNLLNTDWAQWNDAYHFMENKNEAFIKSNLAFTTFENAKLNLILFFSTNGKLFYGKNYDLATKKFIPIPTDLLNFFENEKNFITHTQINSNKMGIMKTNEGYVVLSSLPIVTSEGKGPIRGTVLMGYFFTNQTIEKLSVITDLKIEFIPTPINQGNKMSLAYEALKSGQPYYIATNDQLIYGYSFISDINNEPIGILRISVPRTLYLEGQKALVHYLAIIISAGIILLALIWYLLKIFVLDRIISVSKQVIDINNEARFSKRIKISGKDELNNMVSAVNTLMEIIELSQEQLKYRIFLRTEELERLSKLNKNLYNEMSRQKEVEIQLREGEKTLRHMAYYDTLTGLPNRLFFNEILKNILAKSERDGTGIAILFMDADKFKSINDTYGHDIGDKFLIHAGKQLKKSIKESDIAARLAGDEFIICLTHTRSKAQINKVAETILQTISIPLHVNGMEISSTFSIGISIYPEDGVTIEELEKHADLAMYYAKTQSSNVYCYYDEIKKENTLY